MKLNEIRTFIAVAEAQSVQEAANRLGLTQSAVSRLIQRLEAELGVALFDRQTKPLTLTRDGEMALAHGRRVLKASDEMLDAFAGSGQPMGLLRLGVSHVLTALAASRPLDDLRAAFPDLTLRLHSDWSTPLLDQVRGGTLDGALVLLGDGQTPPEDLLGHCLSREPVHVIAASGMVAGMTDAAAGWTLPAMNALGWVVQPDGCKYRSAMIHTLARYGLSPNVTVESYDQTLLVSLVARGVGFGLAPLRLIAPTVHAAGVRPVAVPDFALTVAVWLVRARFTGRLAAVFDVLETSLMEGLEESGAAPAVPLHSAAE